MSSSPIEGGAPLPGRRDPAGPSEEPSAGPAAVRLAGSGSHRRWFKRMLPRSLFGRSLLIIIVPLILMQVIATWIFYERHWETVARRLSTAVAGDVMLTVEAMQLARSAVEEQQFLARIASPTELRFDFERGATLPAALPGPLGNSLEQHLASALDERVGRPHRLDAIADAGALRVTVQVPDGVLHVWVPRQRLYTSTTYIFVLWMTGSSLVLFGVATLFMRNQVRSLRRLAAAAESFGKGRDVPHFKLEGATEVRQAAAAFLSMRDRIQRQISQRTEMLAGVSHDLRTPLTRLKLALELIGDEPTVEELKSDVGEMERMVQAYLDFARGEGSEPPRDADVPLLLEEVVANARRDGAAISLTAPEEYAMPLRADALKRCLANLIGNARRHGSHIWLTALPTREGIDILIDDDGPGVPADERESVFRPFFRLDASRNPSTGGVGLGLTIARDVARSHGGDLVLDESPQGGLRARLHLPR